jgi:ParB family chromosome partitioning protein
LAKGETRLGKGLGALLEEYLEDEQTRSGPERELAIDEIRSNPFQPRTRFSDEALKELADSIRENGLLQPLVVRPSPSGWEIVAGERRWRALQRLQWEKVPVIIRDLTDEQMLVLALVENLQREDLGPLEEAHGYQQLIDHFGLSRQDVGERVGRDRSTVSNALRLLGLPGPVQQLIGDGSISAGHGRAILGLDNARRQVTLARRVARDGLSVRQTERRVRAMRETTARPRDDGARTTGPRRDPAARRAEKLLERALGTQVRVQPKRGGGGDVRITFHDAEDFARLVQLLAGPEASGMFDVP